MAKERLLLVMLGQEFLKINSSFVEVMWKFFTFWYRKKSEREHQWLKYAKGLIPALKEHLS